MEFRRQQNDEKDNKISSFQLRNWISHGIERISVEHTSSESCTSCENIIGTTSDQDLQAYLHSTEIELGARWIGWWRYLEKRFLTVPWRCHAVLPTVTLNKWWAALGKTMIDGVQIQRGTFWGLRQRLLKQSILPKSLHKGLTDAGTKTRYCAIVAALHEMNNLGFVVILKMKC